MEKEKMMIFLDIDGVLNTKADWKRPYTLNPACIKGFKAFMAEKQKKYRCSIILTSSWKHGYDYARRHSGQIQALIDELAKANLRILGKTDDNAIGDRAREVADFIKQHHLQDVKCMVLDDDKSLFKSRMPDNVIFYLTDEAYGMQKKPGKELL